MLAAPRGKAVGFAVEFSSLIAREGRMGGLDAQAGTQAVDRFEAMIDESFSVLLPNAADFDLAKAYLVAGLCRRQVARQNGRD